MQTLGSVFWRRYFNLTIHFTDAPKNRRRSVEIEETKLRSQTLLIYPQMLRLNHRRSGKFLTESHTFTFTMTGACPQTQQILLFQIWLLKRSCFPLARRLLTIFSPKSWWGSSFSSKRMNITRAKNMLLCLHTFTFTMTGSCLPTQQTLSSKSGKADHLLPTAWKLSVF